MRKPSIYVETSVWSQAFADDAPESRDATLEFLATARRGAYELFVSEVVLAEISRASDELAAQLGELVQGLGPGVLEFDEEIDALARSFLEHRALPASKVEDAQHVAVAVVNELDVLVSWNYRHLVNVRRREMFHQISVMNGYYKPLHVVTPPELNDES